MPLDQDVQQLLDELKARLSDFRITYCRLEPQWQAQALRLEGAVLDQDTLLDVQAAFTVRLPTLAVDWTGVQVLRQSAPQLLTVQTNLTSLHKEPSFLAEMLSQVLNGALFEALIEQGRWMFVRQQDGYLGWTYRPYLTPAAAPTSTHLVVEPVSELLADGRHEAMLLTRVLGGTYVNWVQTKDGWGQIALAGGLSGWLPVTHLRSLKALPVSMSTRRAQITADSARFTGVPYLWGGASANGIDCSGLAQLLHRLAGVTIPRDADQQCAVGKPVEPPFQPGDLLFFGDGEDWRSITHVAVSLGGWKIIHSSRSRNGVYTDDVQAVPHLRESFICARSLLA